MNYTMLAEDTVLSKTVAGLATTGVEGIVVENRDEALKKIKELIPKGASVMNGSSRTLEQIGFIDYLKSETHGWNNLHESIVKEKDPIKQAALRNEAVTSDYYLGSVHALIEDGQFIIASNTGSQLPHIVFTSPNLVFVVGSQKIVPTLAEGFKRLEEYVVPMEDERMKNLYGVGTMLSKVLIFKHENPIKGRKVHMIIVKEELGF